jgi:hypothetical protein
MGDGKHSPHQSRSTRGCFRNVILVWLFVSACARAQGPAVLPRGVDIRIHAQPAEATVGDPITLDLDVTAPPGSKVTVSNPGTRAGAFEILDFQPGPIGLRDRKPQANTASVEHRARIVAAIYKTGQYTFPPVQVVVRTADANYLESSSPPVTVTVTSVLTPQDQELRDLKRQADLPGSKYWVLWAALGAALLAGAGLAWWYRARRRRCWASSDVYASIDLLQAAEDELRDLIGRGLLERGFVKQFYVALADVVRKAAEAVFGVPAREMTTSEVMQALRDRSVAAPGSTVERIETLLLACDLVKFAKYHPAQAENESAVREASGVLQDCRAFRTQPEAAPMPEAGPSR